MQTKPIIKNTSVDNKTIEVNGEGQLTAGAKLLKEIAENILNISILKTETSSSLIDANDFAELYNSSSGLNSSVNSSETDSLYNVTDNYYFNYDDVSEHNLNLDTLQAGLTGFYGFKIKANQTATISNVVKVAGATGTHCKIFNSSGGELKSVAFSGVNAPLDYEIISGNYYYIEVGNPTGTHTIYRKNSGVVYPYSTCLIDWVYSSHNGVNNSDIYAFNIEKLEFSEQKETKITHNLSLDSVFSNVFVIAYDNNGKVAGIGDYKLQITDGINTTTELEPNVNQDISNITGIPTKLIVVQKSTAKSKINRVVGLFN